MLVRGLAALLGAVGCNWAFGLEPGVYQPPPDADRPDADPRADNDRDGIKDVDDSCIAPEVDTLIDTDGDSVPNGSDLCPFDARATNDSDQDGIADLCDPFPTAGDRLRCMMAFSDPDLNSVMWRARDMTALWTLFEPRTLWGYRGSIVADWPLEGTAPTTTFHIYGRYPLNAATTSTFDVLARAATAPQPTDAGCRITMGQSWTMGIMPGPSEVFILQKPVTGGYYHLTVTLHAETGYVRCGLRLSNGNATAHGTQTTWPAGYLAFAVNGNSIFIDGIAVYERDDAPPI